MTKQNTSKAPSVPWYPKDWLSDMELKQCSASTRGIWADLLMGMWMAKEQGRIECSVDEIQALVGKTTNEEILGFIADAYDTEFCDFRFMDEKFNEKMRGGLHSVRDLSVIGPMEIEIINRRTWRTTKRKLTDRDRKRKTRERENRKTGVLNGVPGNIPDNSKESPKKVTPDFQPLKPSPPSPSPSAEKGLSKDKPDFASPKDALNVPTKQPKGQNSKDSKSGFIHFISVFPKRVEEIDVLCIKILSTEHSRPWHRKFNPYQWVQKQCNLGYHIDAIIVYLKGIIQYWDKIQTDPWGYTKEGIKSASQNMYEKQNITEAQEVKKAYENWINSPDFKKMLFG